MIAYLFYNINVRYVYKFIYMYVLYLKVFKIKRGYTLKRILSRKDIANNSILLHQITSKISK